MVINPIKKPVNKIKDSQSSEIKFRLIDSQSFEIESRLIQCDLDYLALYFLCFSVKYFFIFIIIVRGFLICVADRTFIDQDLIFSRNPIKISTQYDCQLLT